MSGHNPTVLRLTQCHVSAQDIAPRAVNFLQQEYSLVYNFERSVRKIIYDTPTGMWRYEALTEQFKHLAEASKNYPLLSVDAQIVLGGHFIDVEVLTLASFVEQTGYHVHILINSRAHEALYHFKSSLDRVDRNIKSKLLQLFVNLAVAVQADGFVFSHANPENERPISDTELRAAMMQPHLNDKHMLGLLNGIHLRDGQPPPAKSWNKTKETYIIQQFAVLDLLL